MKRLIQAILICVFATNAAADYSSHQFHYMEIGLSKCKSIASDAARTYGFSDPQSQDFIYAGENYSVLFGTNKDGYSFQYTCESKKGFGYLIINGPKVDKKNELRDAIGGDIESRIKKANRN
ncbi:MAG: hypothetical protein ACTS8S_01335 [Giesbergeria sp.]